MEETVSLWNKKMSDLTVGDNVKVAGMTMAFAVVAPMAIMAGAGCAINLYEKIRGHKKVELKVVETPQETEV